MKVRMNRNHFKITFIREIITALLENNCFDYCFQVLFVNVTGWILLWILKLLSDLNISVNIIHPEIYDSQGLNEKLNLIGGAMKFFSKRLLGNEIFSLALWSSGLQNIFWKICKALCVPCLYLVSNSYYLFYKLNHFY